MGVGESWVVGVSVVDSFEFCSIEFSCEMAPEKAAITVVKRQF